jgi:Nucleotidyl transferase AbiEii toxin, Type IV TA system
MTTETDVLALVSERLSAEGIAFMLTGSFALGYYATPRMTRDLDIVVAIQADKIDGLVAAFSADFYIDADDVRLAVRSERLFNLMHYASGIKVDLIVQKSSAYRLHEFSRRQPVNLGSAATWIVSREDLILSKLVWAHETESELQLRDVRQLLNGPIDREYLSRWACILGVDGLLRELLP